jgi:NAD(P)-dependent dehydrogenase (short-subunit alcohol dehydrogenase family)
VGPPLDLVDPRSVRAFAKTFLATHDTLDVLVNNAGVNTSTKWRLDDSTGGMVAVRTAPA